MELLCERCVFVCGVCEQVGVKQWQTKLAKIVLIDLTPFFDVKRLS